MKKRKNPQKNHKQILLVLALGTFMLVSMRFPLEFIGDFFYLTKVFHLGIAFLTLIYAMRLLRIPRVKYVAVILILITLAVTSFNYDDINRSIVSDCELHNSNTKVCSLIWVGDTMVFRHGFVRYLTIGDFPLGIATYKYRFDYLTLF